MFPHVHPCHPLSSAALIRGFSPCLSSAAAIITSPLLALCLLQPSSPLHRCLLLLICQLPSSNHRLSSAPTTTSPPPPLSLSSSAKASVVISRPHLDLSHILFPTTRILPTLNTVTQHKTTHFNFNQNERQKDINTNYIYGRYIISPFLSVDVMYSSQEFIHPNSH